MYALDLPPDWAEVLLLVKGGFALIGVLLLLWHMNHEWPRMVAHDQRARYLLLLGYGVFQAAATYEQLADGGFGWRYLVALVLSFALVVVAAYSIWASHKRRATATP